MVLLDEDLVRGPEIADVVSVHVGANAFPDKPGEADEEQNKVVGIHEAPLLGEDASETSLSCEYVATGHRGLEIENFRTSLQ